MIQARNEKTAFLFFMNPNTDFVCFDTCAHLYKCMFINVPKAPKILLYIRGFTYSACEFKKKKKKKVITFYYMMVF